MKFKNRDIIMMMLVILGIYIFMGGKTANAYDNKNIASYRELRYNDMFGQTSWWSCGPASIATLLHYYYKIDTSEQELIQLAAEISESDAYLSEGIDLLLIKNIFEVYDIEAVGYRIDTMSLSRYYDQGGLPLILYFTLPKKHYVLGIGKLNNRELLIADPSFGHLVISFNSLVKQRGFKGIVLATIPSQESHIKNIKNMQSEMLSIYKNRRNNLSNLR